MVKINTEKVSGSRNQPKGTMSKEMLKRHGLVANLPSNPGYQPFRKAKALKTMIQLVKSYRLAYHNVMERHLAATFKYSCQYMLCPLDKGRDERQVNEGSNRGDSGNENDLSAVQSPLKV